MTGITIFPARKLGAIELDAVIAETHSSSITVTDNPIEDGSTISDHAYSNPKEFVIVGGISNTPFLPREGVNNAVDQTRISAAFKQLQDLQASAVPFDVQSGLRLYKNMLITSLDVTQDAETFYVLIFRAALREVQLVKSLAVFVPASQFPSQGAAGSGQPQNATANKSTSTANRGQVAAKPVKEQSLLKKLSAGL